MKFICVIIIALTFSACKTVDRQEEDVFTVDLRSPQIEIGEIEWQMSRFLGIGGLRKDTVPVTYFPREDAVRLQFRVEFFTYHQFWSREGRQAFIEALAQYNEDFESRNLPRKNARRTRRAYGVTEGYLIWQMYTFTVQARANMNVELGYEFRDKAPYFTVNQREAEYIDPISRDQNRTSQIMTMYFTRAQAEQLAELFDQQFLRELGAPETDSLPRTRNVVADEY